jgi:hypothetical protein
MNDRGPNGDMNRKFTHEDNNLSMEDKIVNILKKLISESDYLLNLHDGSGYYSPEYIDESRNPMNYGQAVIADCSEFSIPGSGTIINLDEMAEEVIDEVNQYITNDLYKFHFMNTRTADEDSPHKEQRKSATYYAVNVHHIPAFGVETSKALPSTDLKVSFHNLIINAFMKRFDIIPQSPGLALDNPIFKYLVVSLNGKTPIVINKNESLNIDEGDSINISHIEANYERGLSLDILGYGDINDYGKDFKIFKNTKIIVRRDNNTFGEIPIRVAKKTASVSKEKKTVGNGKVEAFIIEAMGRKLLVSQGETLELVKGEKIKIVDILPDNLSGIQVNFKGFVGDKSTNSGEDRGYVIDTANDLIQRYSIDKNDEIYPIIASRGENEIGQIKVKLIPPKLSYLSFKINNGKRVLLGPEDSVKVNLNDNIRMEEVTTNLYDNSDISVNINGQNITSGDSMEARNLCASGHNELKVLNGGLLIGKVYLDMENQN